MDPPPSLQSGKLSPGRENSCLNILSHQPFKRRAKADPEYSFPIIQSRRNPGVMEPHGRARGLLHRGIKGPLIRSR